MSDIFEGFEHTGNPDTCSVCAALEWEGPCNECPEFRWDTTPGARESLGNAASGCASVVIGAAVTVVALLCLIALVDYLAGGSGAHG